MIESLLPGIPLLLLVVSLLLGRFPGLETALRIGDSLAAGRHRRVDSAAEGSRPELPRPWSPAGGLLLAHSLCGRAPPA